MSDPVAQERTATDKGRISLSDLLAEVGNDNLKFQVLNQCLVGQQWGPTKKRKASKFTFVTAEDFTAVINDTRMGLIVFLDKDKCEDALKRLREKPSRVSKEEQKM